MAKAEQRFEKMLAVQRPVVLAHIRSIRRRHPDASPAELIVILERRYTAAATTGGAAVGATAVIPGAGTAVALGLSGAETAGFLEASALFAQSVSEVHGIAAADPQRSSALVMTMMLGSAGTDLVRQLLGQATDSGDSRSRYWGQVVMAGLPQFAVGPLLDGLKKRMIRHFVAKGSAGLLGRVLPFGVGAAIGAAGNYTLARKVVLSSRHAFGPAGSVFPADLAARPPRLSARGRKKAEVPRNSAVDTPAPDTGP